MTSHVIWADPPVKKVGPDDRVLDMREMWSSYDQSFKLGDSRPAMTPYKGLVFCQAILC